MKVLALAEFDPAGVLSGWKHVLRGRGVDFRLAVLDVYAGMPTAPDWVLRGDPGERLGDPDALRAFARETDVVITNPAIGQPWSYTTTSPRYDTIEWDALDHVRHRAARVALFHGSRNAWANAENYASFEKGRNYALWATTLDYAHRMSARLVPPAVEVHDWATATYRQASPRKDDDPLVIAHAPTDPDNCHTEIFLDACRKTGAIGDFIFQKPRATVLRRKQVASAGFDHLRGAFSVNTVENMALGLAPLVALREEYLPILEREVGEPASGARALFPFQDEAGFRADLRALVLDPALTRARQVSALEYYDRCWRPEVIGAKLEKLLEEL